MIFPTSTQIGTKFSLVRHAEAFSNSFSCEFPVRWERVCFGYFPSRTLCQISERDAQPPVRGTARTRAEVPARPHPRRTSPLFARAGRKGARDPGGGGSSGRPARGSLRPPVRAGPSSRAALRRVLNKPFAPEQESVPWARGGRARRDAEGAPTCPWSICATFPCSSGRGERGWRVPQGALRARRGSVEPSEQIHRGLISLQTPMCTSCTETVSRLQSCSHLCSLLHRPCCRRRAARQPRLC